MHEYVRMYVGSGTRLVLVTGMSQKKKKKKKRRRSRAEAGLLASAASLIDTREAEDALLGYV